MYTDVGKIVWMYISKAAVIAEQKKCLDQHRCD